MKCFKCLQLTKITLEFLKLDLPKGQLIFIWGARGVGTSTFLKKQYPGAIYYDLLSTDGITRFRLRPGIVISELESLTEDELKQLVIINDYFISLF